jgi:hypothetical protein
MNFNSSKSERSTFVKNKIYQEQTNSSPIEMETACMHGSNENQIFSYSMNIVLHTRYSQHDAELSNSNEPPNVGIYSALWNLIETAVICRTILVNDIRLCEKETTVATIRNVK